MNEDCMNPRQNQKGQLFFISAFQCYLGGSIHVCILPCTPTTHIASSSLKACDEQTCQLASGQRPKVGVTIGPTVTVRLNIFCGISCLREQKGCLFTHANVLSQVQMIFQKLITLILNLYGNYTVKKKRKEVILFLIHLK